MKPSGKKTTRKLSRTEAGLFLIPLFFLVLFGGWWFEDIHWAINPNAEPFEKKVRSLAGFNALDCGRKQFAPGDLNLESDSCAVSAFQARRSFRIIRSSIESDGIVRNIALVGKSDGKSYWVEYMQWPGSPNVIHVYERVNARIVLSNGKKMIVEDDILPVENERMIVR